MNTLAFYFIFFLSLTLSHAIIEADYCIADRSLPRGPAGYACKDPTNVTTDDFVFTRFRGVKDTTTNIFKVNVTLATVEEFPGVNGLGISMSRLDFGIGGVIPVHSHRTSEIIIVAYGVIIAGIIDTDNVAYYKRLEAGDVMIFPKYMLHFQINIGESPALAFVALNGANPGFQTTSIALFGSNLLAEMVSQITAINPKEVRCLQSIFSEVDTTSYDA